MLLGYVKDDLRVFHHYMNMSSALTEEGDENNYTEIPFSENKYVLFVTLAGDALVQNGITFTKMKENHIMSVNINDTFGYSYPENSDFSALVIRMHPSLFRAYDDDNFFRAFSSNDINEKIVDLNTHEAALIKMLVNAVKNNIYHHFGRDHFLPKILSIISELSVLYDKQHENVKKTNDGLHVRIIEYINNYYLEEISYKKLNELFFISSSSVNRIMHYYYNMTLHQYVKLLRLRDAKKYLENEAFRDMSTHKIAELCGFKTYSTFYRAFKSQYGCFPSHITPDKPADQKSKILPFS